MRGTKKMSFWWEKLPFLIKIFVQKKGPFFRASFFATRNNKKYKKYFFSRQNDIMKIIEKGTFWDVLKFWRDSGEEYPVSQTTFLTQDKKIYI